MLQLASTAAIFQLRPKVAHASACVANFAIGSELRSDWDWHRLRKALKPNSILERELERLVLQEGFTIFAGAWGEEPVYFSRAGYPGVVKLRKLLEAAPKNHWAGFQIFYPMRETDLRNSTGLDLVESMLAVFREVTPAMNRCMQIELAERAGRE